MSQAAQPSYRHRLSLVALGVVGFLIAGYVRSLRNVDQPLVPEPTVMQNGKVRANLPKGWIHDIEPGEDNDRLYAPQKANARVLRVSVIDYANNRLGIEADLKLIAKDFTKRFPLFKTERISSERYLLHCSEDFVEDGKALRQERWLVMQTRSLGISSCLYSYTMQRGEKSQPRTREEVAFLDKAIRETEF